MRCAAWTLTRAPLLLYECVCLCVCVQSSGGTLSDAVERAVDTELAALSPAPPTLPWGAGSGSGGGSRGKPR